MTTDSPHHHALDLPHSEEAPVLVYVDDERANLRVFEFNFREHFNVVTFASSDEALQFLKDRSWNVAVVIADLRMPGMTGSELLERVSTVAPRAKRLLLTGSADIDATDSRYAARCFPKPWDFDELARAFSEAVADFAAARD